MTEQGRGLGELGHQLQPLVAGSTVVELHLVCQAPGLAAALKCAKMFCKLFVTLQDIAVCQLGNNRISLIVQTI